MKTLDLDKKGHIPTVEIEALADTNTPVGLWGAAAADPSSSPKNTEQEEARPLKKTLHYLGTTPAATSDQAAAAAIKDPTDAATTFPSPPLPQSENTETPATTDEAAAVAAATAPPATSPPNEEPITAGKDDEPVVLQSVSYRSKVIESKGFAVQFAAMEDYERAMSIVQNLGDSDIKEVIVSKKTAKTNNLYKVFVGPFNTQEIAFLYLQHCRKAGFDCYVINLETMELLKDPSPAAKPVKRR
jgi:cell division septation protein DedD